MKLSKKQRIIYQLMTNMKVSLPDAVKAFVNEQVVERNHGTGGEHVCDLIGKHQQRLQLRNLLLEGGRSAPAAATSSNSFSLKASPSPSSPASSA